MSEHNDEFFDEEEEELHENEAFTSIWDLVPGYTQSPLDSMLENEDSTTLEQVLDEDTLIQELKSANHKVIAFLSKDENIDKLIQYIITEEYLQPGQTLTSADLEKEEEETLKRTYKYPFITSEIFNCDIEEIILPIVRSKEKTIALFSYLLNKDESKTPKNPSLSQYFVKAVSNLLQKYYKEVVDSLMEKHSDAFNILKTFFTEHIGLCDMDTLLLKVLGFETSEDNFDQDGFGAFATQQRIRELFLMKQRGNDQELQQKRKQVRDWAINNNFFDLIFSKLEQSLDNEEIQRNVFSLLSQIVEKGYNNGNDLTICLLSEKSLNTVLDIMLKNTCSTILVHGIPFLRVVISANEESEESDGDESSDDGVNKHSNHSATISKVIPTILSRTKQFLSLINDTEFVSKISKLELSHAVLDPPLGETRLKVVEHLLTIFKVSQNNTDYQKELISLGVMGVLIDLFFTYEFNSMLHCLVFDMIKIVITGNNSEMKLSLLKDTELCEKILKANEKNKAKLQEPKGSSLGHMGFIIEISNLLKKIGDANSDIAKHLSSIDGWKDFCFGFLQERNIQNEKQLGGPVPIGTFGASYMGEEDDDDDYGYDEDSSDSDEEVIVRRGTSDSDSDEDDDGEVVRKHY